MPEIHKGIGVAKPRRLEAPEVAAINAGASPYLEPAMPELIHAGMRCNLEWDRETEHWWGLIDGTEVRITAGHYPDACDLFRQTVEVLTDTARGPDADAT